MTTGFSIIGAGRLGTSLGRALVEKGYYLKSLSCRSTKSASESRRIIGQGEIYTDNSLAAAQAKILFLTVPDDTLTMVTHELASSSIDWKNRIVFHCSGLLSSQLLFPIQKKGASTASLHPVQTFPRKNTKPLIFQGVYFGFEGNQHALNTAQKIVKTLQGNLFFVPSTKKPAYHAACSMASNLFVALLYTASALLKDSGIDKKTSLKILFPLVEYTWNNIKNCGLEKALSGPLSRGDKKTVAFHVDALRSQPETAKLYRLLAKKSLQLLEEADRLDPSSLILLQDLLEDK